MPILLSYQPTLSTQSCPSSPLTDCRLIQRYASEPNQSSYIATEIIPAYRRAAAEYGQYPPQLQYQLPITTLTIPTITGTGKAARQRSIVQGRITDGTLFPHVSTKIQTNITQLIETTFRALQIAIVEILDLVDHDVKMAMSSGETRGAGNENQDTGRESEELEEALDEIRKIRRRHEEVLSSVVEI
jgi:hypothetical protein